MRRRLSEFAGLRSREGSHASASNATESNGSSECTTDGTSATARGALPRVPRSRAQSESLQQVRRRAQSDYLNTARFMAVSKPSAPAPGDQGRRFRAGSTMMFSRSRSASGRYESRPRLGSKRDSSVHSVDRAVLESMELVEQQADTGELQTTGIQQPPVEEDFSEDSCLICMGVFTTKKPSIPIPCTRKCNLAPVHAKCIFEWKEQKRGAGSCPLCRSDLGEIPYSPPDLLQLSNLVMFNTRKSFCTTPIPKGAGMVRCFITARNGFWGSPVRYEMYVQAPTTFRFPLGPIPGITGPEKGDRILMTAHKRMNKWGNSVIDISLDERGKDFDRASPNYVGAVQSNTSGLEHTLICPFKSSAHGSNSGGHRELAAVVYTQNRVGSASGPRRMQVALPNVKEVKNEEFLLGHGLLGSGSFGTPSGNLEIASTRNPESVSLEEVDEEEEDDDEDLTAASGKKYITEVYRPKSKLDQMASLLKRGKEYVTNNQSLMFGQNREPYWLESIQAFSLDFQGRVTLPSNKNFQLELNSLPDELAMQFGKVVSAEEGSLFGAIYTVDLQWPLSPLQAFGICLSACDRKLAVA